MPHQVHVRAFVAAAVASTGTATSGAIDCRRFSSASLLFTASSVSATADMQIDMAVSSDGTTFGSYDTTLVGSTGGLTTPEGLNYVAIPDPLPPFLKLLATGIGANPADGLLTATLEGTEEVPGMWK